MKIKNKIIALMLGLTMASSAYSATNGWYNVEGVGAGSSTYMWVNLIKTGQTNVTEAIMTESRWTERGVDRALSVLLATTKTDATCWINFSSTTVSGRVEITSYYCLD